MNNKFILGGVIVSLIFSFFSFFRNPEVKSFLGAAGTLLVENYIPYFMYNDGYYSEKGIVLSGASGDITTGDDLTVADDLTVTTTNAATSTASFGCIQTTATSTATAISLTFNAVSTSTTNMTNSQAANGFVQWKYGSCPF